MTRRKPGHIVRTNRAIGYLTSYPRPPYAYFEADDGNNLYVVGIFLKEGNDDEKKSGRAVGDMDVDAFTGIVRGRLFLDQVGLVERIKGENLILRPYKNKYTCKPLLDIEIAFDTSWHDFLRDIRRGLRMSYREFVTNDNVINGLFFDIYHKYNDNLNGGIIS